jgi:hypothetical protein
MKSVLQTHKADKRRQKVRRAILWITIPLIVFVVSSIVVLLLPQLQVTSVSVFGNELVSEDDVLSIARTVLREHVLAIFPRSNIFLFSSAVLSERIRAELPLIATADITRSFGRDINITVSERETWGVYCVATERDCFYIATDGILIASAPQLTGSVIFRVVDMRMNGTQSTGDRAIEKDRAARTQQVAVWLWDRYGLELREVVLGREFEDRTELYTNEGWYILIDEQTDITHALENTELVLEQRIPDRLELEYLDIRFEGKVFYKNKGD